MELGCHRLGDPEAEPAFRALVCIASRDPKPSGLNSVPVVFLMEPGVAREGLCETLNLYGRKLTACASKSARQRGEIRQLQRAGIPTASAEALLGRMLNQIDELCAERDRLKKEQPAATKGRVLGGRQWWYDLSATYKPPFLKALAEVRTIAVHGRRCLFRAVLPKCAPAPLPGHTFDPDCDARLYGQNHCLSALPDRSA